MRVRERRNYPMKNKRLALLLFVALVVMAATTRLAIAQEDARLSPELSSAQQTQIKSVISKFMATSHAPGISVAVVENGEFVWSSGFGFADLENHVAATSATLYRLGSISKPITATGAMQLWEQKKLDLDAPIQKYCPAFPQKEWPITTRELLGTWAEFGITSLVRRMIPKPGIRATSMIRSRQAFSSSLTIRWSRRPAQNFVTRRWVTRGLAARLKGHPAKSMWITSEKTFWCRRG